MVVYVFLEKVLKYKIFSHGAFLSPLAFVYAMLIAYGSVNSGLTPLQTIGFFFPEHLALLAYLNKKQDKQQNKHQPAKQKLKKKR
jgi:hypothetical protein